jgi:peroxiredoxin
MTRSRRQVLRHTAAALAAALLPAAAAHAGATVGQPAPAFELRDTAGRPVKLADFKGRTVVLEWTNPGCPFVAKHYGSNNMQALQKDAQGDAVVWLAISSTAPGTTDYLAPAALAAKYKGWGAAPAALLMDDAGQVGRAYGARTTPHMYVVDPKGVLVYAGGIDDKRSADPADIKGAKNFVRAALADLKAGRPVATPTAAPYGCSIKYAAM